MPQTSCELPTVQADSSARDNSTDPGTESTLLTKQQHSRVMSAVVILVLTLCQYLSAQYERCGYPDDGNACHER